jgi:UTP--glucose-1-phosphate uridylyltransferase
MQDKARFAALLQSIRGDETRQRFAKKVDISVSFLSFLENRRNGRFPSRRVLNSIVATARLRGSPLVQELLEAAGYANSDVDENISSLISALELDHREKDLLLDEIAVYAQRWKELRRARAQEVRKAVIPAAGFRASLLAPQRLEGTILHAVQEAVKGGIQEIVVVMAPTKELPRFDKLRALKASVRTVTQEEPLGLGHAILTARTLIREEPFAVILSVDVNESQTIIGNMIKCYREVKKPIVGVNRLKAVSKAEIRRYGFVTLDGKEVEEKKGSSNTILRRLHYVANLEEKPPSSVVDGPLARIIQGRYILPPDIFDALQATPKNPKTDRIEITDALSELRRRNHLICAYDMDRTETMLPMASIRALMGILVESVSQPKKLKKIIRVTREALEKLSDLDAST